MNIVIPIILIIIGNIIAGYICNYTDVVNWIKGKIKIKHPFKIDIINFVFILLMICIYYLIIQKYTEREVIQAVLFFITVVLVNVMSNLKQHLNNS